MVVVKTLPIFDDHDDDEPRTAEEMLASVKTGMTDLESRIKEMSENLDDAAAGLRRDVSLSRREMLEVLRTLQRVQGRADHQLVTLASIIVSCAFGVAAVVLGVSHPF